MLIFKNIEKKNTTILIKKKNLRQKNFIFFIFGPLGNTHQVLKANIIDITINEIYLYYKKSYVDLIQTNTSLIKNLYWGIHKGYFAELFIIGIGYKVLSNMQTLDIFLGYSHKITIKIPKAIKLIISKKSLLLWSFNLQELSMFCKMISFIRKPNIYKGKGILPANIQFKLKEGKKSK